MARRSWGRVDRHLVWLRYQRPKARFLCRFAGTVKTNRGCTEYAKGRPCPKGQSGTQVLSASALEIIQGSLLTFEQACAPDSTDVRPSIVLVQTPTVLRERTLVCFDSSSKCAGELALSLIRHGPGGGQLPRSVPRNHRASVRWPPPSSSQENTYTSLIPPHPCAESPG